jgi:hypothetical protein
MTEDQPTKSVLAWAHEKRVSDFDLAGAIVLASWPRGNVYDQRAPLLVTEPAFDEAIRRFRTLEIKLCPSLTYP